MNKILFLLVFCSFNVFAAPVDINKADAATIAESLNGVGLKKAEAIVADRVKNGPFSSAEDLSRVNGIGTKTILKNKADILVAVPPKGK